MADDPTTAELMMTRPVKALERKRGARSSGRRSSRSARSLAGNGGKVAQGLVGRGKRMIEDARRWAEDAGSSARGMHLPSPPSLETFTEANPIILGAVGLGIGVIIGALLPRDAFHSGMQNLGLTGGTSSHPTQSGTQATRSTRRRSSRSRSRK